ncbi:putative galacturonosyltransferase 13 isoform X2 [Tasmannia lanceolata]
MRLVRDLYKILNQVNSEEIPDGTKLPASFSEFVAEMKNNQCDAKTFAIRLKAMVEKLENEARESKLLEVTHKHFAATAIPEGIHCLSLRLTDEYSSNAHARKQLPSPELLPLLSDNSYCHFIIASDNILAASVVVNSTVRSSLNPKKIIFHVITDKKTYAGMHSWFALNPLPPAIVEVKGVHQFEWLTRENVPVLEAVEKHQLIRNYYHGNHISGANLSESPRSVASRLLARSPKYISLLNHLRIYLPELFPNLNKVVFLDDDVVIQRDLSPLWEINLDGKVNGAVETCEGKDKWVMSKRFKNYFNFSQPLIAKNLDPEECAWAYGMNVFDLAAWRKTSIRGTYHYWVKENLKSNLTMWRLGTLPPALIAFRGNVHPIDPSWHMLGLGYQNNTDLDCARKAAVIHYNGQCKPWLEIAFEHLQPLWTKHVNYSNDFVRNCHIVEP